MQGHQKALLLIIFNAVVANPKKLLYTVANPARGLLNKGKKKEKKSRLTRDGTAEPVSRDQILRHERGQGNIIFSCSADHVQDWQPCPVDPYSCYMCDHEYIHIRST